MRVFLALVATLLIGGCASLSQETALSAYTGCAALDVATTTIGLSTNTMMEGNPLTKALFVRGLGHVAGTVVPLIGLSVLAYYVLQAINDSEVTQLAAVATCGISINNARIIGAAQ